MIKQNESVNRGNTNNTLENTANIFPFYLDPMDHPYFAQKNFLLAISANIGVFLIFLLLPRLILLAAEDFDFAEFFIVIVPASIILPYATGFLIGYSAAKVFRIYYPFDKKNHLEIDSGMMSGYLESQKYSKNWLLWLFASTCGFLNLMTFTFSLIALKKLL